MSPTNGQTSAGCDALGDKVLLDGESAVYFLPTFPYEALVECVERIVDLFHPRLVLGISDEPPPDGDIERVRLVGKLVREIARTSEGESTHDRDSGHV